MGNGQWGNDNTAPTLQPHHSIAVCFSFPVMTPHSFETMTMISASAMYVAIIVFVTTNHHLTYSLKLTKDPESNQQMEFSKQRQVSGLLIHIIPPEGNVWTTYLSCLPCQSADALRRGLAAKQCCCNSQNFPALSY